MYHREQQKWQAMRAVTRERNRLVLFSVNELNAKIDACIARMNPPPVEEVPVIYEEEEDKHATLNKLAIARMFKTTMAHGSAMDVLTALEDLNQKLKIAAGATDPEGVAHKLRTARELSASLEHQHHQAVAKASHLKTQLERHQQILSDMKMTGESSVPDPVVTLDDGTVATLSSTKTPDLFQADLDLEHARRTANEAQRDIASVSTGVIHLAKLLEAYTKKTPKEDPVKRLSLDRNTIRDVERGDLPDLEKVDTERAAVVRLLSRCELTIVSVREALAIAKQLGDDDDDDNGMIDACHQSPKRGHNLEGPVRLHKTQPMDHHDGPDFMHRCPAAWKSNCGIRASIAVPRRCRSHAGTAIPRCARGRGDPSRRTSRAPRSAAPRPTARPRNSTTCRGRLLTRRRR